MIDTDRPSAIFVGDLHITDHTPQCRTDDFWDTQITKGRWLDSLWREMGCPPIIQVGDVFEKWKSSPAIISLILEHYPPMWTIPGNHDLPAHSLIEYDRSALRVLEYSEGKGPHKWVVMRDEGDTFFDMSIHIMPWGVASPIPPIEDYEVGADGGYKDVGVRRILVAHTMIVDGPTPFDGVLARDFLAAHPQYDLILTGHNHKPIEYCTTDDLSDHTHRTLINPGSFTRQTVVEDHSPSVYLYYAEGNKVDRIMVPHDPSALSRSHIEVKRDRDEKIAAFIDKVREVGGGMDGEYGGEGVEVADISFRRNLEEALGSDDSIPESVKSRIWRIVDGK